MSASQDKDYVFSLKKGFDILRCFSPAASALTNAEIVAITGHPRTTVARLTGTLCDLGYLAVTPDRSYRLTSKILELGYSYLEQFDIRRALDPYIKLLSVRTSAGCSLGVGDGCEIIYINQSSRGLRIDQPHPTIGSRVPMANSAIGHAYLFGLMGADRDSAMATLELHHPDNWPAVRASIEYSFGRIREHGFCYVESSFRVGMSSVAVPFIVPGTGETFSINCAAPSRLMSKAKALEQVGPRMVSTLNHARTFLSQEARPRVAIPASAQHPKMTRTVRPG